MSKPKDINEISKEMFSVELNMTATKAMLKNQMMNVILNGPEDHGALYFIEGEAGIGKTSMMPQVLNEIYDEVCQLSEDEVFDVEAFRHFKKHKGTLFSVNWSAKDPQDLQGQPVPPEKNAHGIYEQKFSNPLPLHGYGMFFQDEANRVFDVSMKATMLSLWTDRGVNGNYMGKGYIQVLAGNNFDDLRYKVSKADDHALSQRYKIIRLKPTFKEVMTHLESTHPNHFMIDFLRDNSEFISLFNPNGTGFSPRTLDWFMKITKRHQAKIKNSDEARFLVETNIDLYFQTQGGLVKSFLNDVVEISFSKIMENPPLMNKVKRHDVPLMKAIVTQSITFLKEKMLNKQEGISDHEKSIYVDMLNTVNSESRLCFTNLIYNDDKAYDILDYIEKQMPEVFPLLKNEMVAFTTAKIR